MYFSPSSPKISKVPGRKKALVWTRDKENFVRDNYLFMTDGDMAECLHCAEATVNRKVNDLGLIRPSYYKSPQLPLIHLLAKWDNEKFLDVPNPETPLLKRIKKKLNKNKLKLRTTKHSSKS